MSIHKVRLLFKNLKKILIKSKKKILEQNIINFSDVFEEGCIVKFKIFVFNIKFAKHDKYVINIGKLHRFERS